VNRTARRGQARQTTNPLDGIKVLSFEIQVAGPYCSMMLADQGADVIKVERPGTGDTARGGAPIVANANGEARSGYFLRFNRNKRSITLDMKSEAGLPWSRREALPASLIPCPRLGSRHKGSRHIGQLNPGCISVR
jgi:crotonobetainyl-CoA:carnitine CoA-transferase CaiB-like acyl-CoA transferase